MIVAAVEKISSVSDAEFALIGANHKILFEREFQCEICLGRRTTPEGLEASRINKGCYGQNRVLYNIGRVDLKSCIGNYYKPWAMTWFKLYRAFKNGIMPFPGSLTEQPARALEIFDAFEHFEHERLEAEQEAALAANIGARDGR